MEVVLKVFIFGRLRSFGTARIKRGLHVLLISMVASSCAGQPSKVGEKELGGPCEDCEATLDYRLLGITPQPTDTLPGFHQNKPKIKVSGTVFQPDGRTPAAAVILYVYQVDRSGTYQPTESPLGWEERHGQHRGWLKTGSDGTYSSLRFAPRRIPVPRSPNTSISTSKSQTPSPTTSTATFLRTTPY